jgi:hypothetical protein
MRPQLEKLKDCRVITYLYRIPNLAPREQHLVPAREAEEGEQQGIHVVDPAEVVFPVYIYHFPTSTASALDLPVST